MITESGIPKSEEDHWKYRIRLALRSWKRFILRSVMRWLAGFGIIAVFQRWDLISVSDNSSPYPILIGMPLALGLCIEILLDRMSELLDFFIGDNSG